MSDQAIMLILLGVGVLTMMAWGVYWVVVP